ncbi:MAG: ECF-type sigma factor [Lysobacter sp.]
MHRHDQHREGADADPDSSAISEAALESITELIGQAQGGRVAAWDQVYAVLYQELHQLARQQIRRHWPGPGHSPTSLVSRTWLRLSQSNLVYQSRDHLVGILVRAMRFALVDEARVSYAAKRRAATGETAISYDPEADAVSMPEIENLLAINQALNTLAEADPRLGQVVEMRYFAGMNDAEIADVLGITPRTVHRDWVRARAYLSSVLDEAANQTLTD